MSIGESFGSAASWLISLEAPTNITPNTIISLANLSFSVDRAWLRSKKKKILYKNSLHISTYAALCPSASHPFDENIHRQQLDILNYTLFQIIHTKDLLLEKNPDAIINHCSFNIPHINHWEQMIQFLIRGIDPSIILVDKKVKEIFTQRELASNIFRSFKAMYQQVCVEKPLTHLIKDIDEYDSHSITNFMSVRRKNFDEAEEPIFTIVTAEHTE